MYSLCGVLSSGGTYRFGDLVVCLIEAYIISSFCKWLFVIADSVLILGDGCNFLAEKLWSGLENFVFDWLINVDR